MCSSRSRSPGCPRMQTSPSAKRCRLKLSTRWGGRLCKRPRRWSVRFRRLARGRQYHKRGHWEQVLSADWCVDVKSSHSSHGDCGKSGRWPGDAAPPPGPWGRERRWSRPMSAELRGRRRALHPSVRLRGSRGRGAKLHWAGLLVVIAGDEPRGCGPRGRRRLGRGPSAPRPDAGGCRTKSTSSGRRTLVAIENRPESFEFGNSGRLNSLRRRCALQ